MKFKSWLMSEAGTSTADIAGFSRITLPLIRRQWPTEFSFDEFKKKKKVIKQPQVEENTAHVPDAHDEYVNGEAMRMAEIRQAASRWFADVGNRQEVWQKTMEGKRVLEIYNDYMHISKF